MIDKSNHDRLRKALDEQFGTAEPDFAHKEDGGSDTPPDCCPMHNLKWLLTQAVADPTVLNMSPAARNVIIETLRLMTDLSAPPVDASGVVKNVPPGLQKIMEALGIPAGAKVISYNGSEPDGLKKAMEKHGASDEEALDLTPLLKAAFDLAAKKPKNLPVPPEEIVAAIPKLVGKDADDVSAEFVIDGVNITKNGQTFHLDPFDVPMLTGTMLAWLWDNDYMKGKIKQVFNATHRQIEEEMDKLREKYSE